MSRAHYVSGLIVAAAMLWAGAACGLQAPSPVPPTLFMTETPSPTPTPTDTPAPTPTHAAGQLRPQVIAAIPHDTDAFTEGLAFAHGLLYESTGMYGSSALREIDPASGKVLRRISLPEKYFGEGLAITNDRLIQLTWRERTAFLYDQATFTQVGQLSYEGEGWGLCFDGRRLYMSDGSSVIAIRDPGTLAVVDRLQVRLDGQPVEMVNELECVGDILYANVWHTHNILQIEKATGIVLAVIDASGLLTPEQAKSAGPEGVLNGIAYDPQDNTFFITGKLWPTLFKVRFGLPGG